MSVPIATNDNALEGLACPQCLQQDGFTIAALVLASVIDAGISSYDDLEWTETSTITCVHCDRRGTVEEFSVRRGDMLLRDDQIRQLIAEADQHVRWLRIQHQDAPLVIVDVPDDSTTQSITYTDLRAAVNELWHARQLPADIDAQIRIGDLRFTAEIADLVFQHLIIDPVTDR